jgi:predicted glycogen debranching enzyme
MRLTLSPNPGEMLLRFVGDRLTFRLTPEHRTPEAYLRTNLGRGPALHAEVLQEYYRELREWDPASIPGPSNIPRGTAWRDVPMIWNDGVWQIEITLTEPGFYHAKGYVLDEHGRQIWPHGADIGITVDPNQYRSGNTIYCAFTRMFGETKPLATTIKKNEPLIENLEKQHYAVIPPSGKLRDLIKEFPHVFGTLGCRILHLLPVNPTPTTYARFGRYGSPYAAEDLTLIDPALVEFDRRSTGVEQFQELTYAAHCHGARVFLDMVINHTGWGSTLQENHPEWFLRKENGVFVSPGAWGTTWEDLVELDHRVPLSWEQIADAFIIWCRRGVDGFRCDAGYKVPTAAWRYIIARVRHEFPDTLFLLEGLGGAWEATEELLTLGGMQWAYSELFQNYSPIQVSGYLDHSIIKSATVGTLVHYSETHDNDRLAAKGRAWSLLRNQLCALTSHTGAFGYTCGVEWLAEEKINVHSCRGLSWGSADNLVSELARLGALLADHPAFFDGAKTRRISGQESAIYALHRQSLDAQDQVLILVNLDHSSTNSFFLPKAKFVDLGEPTVDLLTEKAFKITSHGENLEFRLAAGQSLCLSPTRVPRGLAGHAYRLRRAQHTFAVRALSGVLEPEEIGPHSWTELALLVERDPHSFLGVLGTMDRKKAASDLLLAIQQALEKKPYYEVFRWRWDDRPRISPVPPGHWILITDETPFRATLSYGETLQHTESLEVAGQHIATFAPVDSFRRRREGEARLSVLRFNAQPARVERQLLFLRDLPVYQSQLPIPLTPHAPDPETPIVLLTNGRGGMARMCVDLGAVKSKYDAVLAANLHPELPVDRHIFVKRIRVWANADRFITPLTGANLQSFSPGPPARWEFAAIAGDGQVARIEIAADMLEGKNATVFAVRLLDTSKPGTAVRVTIRFDLEDRNFHTQTLENGGADHHFNSNTHLLPNHSGFWFRPAGDRQVRVSTTSGTYHPASEWSHHIPHTVEQTRGQVGSGDAFSPGWFDLPLQREVPVFLVVSSELEEIESERVTGFMGARAKLVSDSKEAAHISDTFGQQLALAARAFVVRRNEFKTVIAGYPWFLDWGRDSLICARGMLSAGMFEEVRQLLIVFGRFEKDGTLPNTIHGEDASNRDTSDAPLWYGVVCEEFAALQGEAIYDTVADHTGRKIRDVLRSIAIGYAKGTPNGIIVDPQSGLVWSPSHFTWMDTNYPAGTPRQGYPIEIQALWIRLLKQLDRLKVAPGERSWQELAELAEKSLDELFWCEEREWYADVLIAERNTAAEKADQDDALRSNCVIPIMLGLLNGERARRCMENVIRHLFVPGALRSLAPMPVRRPLPIYGSDWRLLNDPHNPYFGRYEGDEDTQRKPAYHNGTAWTWTFPGACEAIARAWDFSPEAKNAARTFLGSMEGLLATGCIGQLPEVLDGDAPHMQRGCDAQAWAATEALRVWKLLND